MLAIAGRLSLWFEPDRAHRQPSRDYDIRAHNIYLFLLPNSLLTQDGQARGWLFLEQLGALDRASPTAAQSAIGATALFEIEDNPDADSNHGAWRASPTLGRNAVHRHEAIIEREAKAQGIDADLVKAIMYVENVQGLDSQIAEATGFGESESLLPMNIRPDPWAAIEDPPANLADPATNIRIAVTLIRRISERIDNPTPAKVASVWNFTGRESVNDFGERVRDAYVRRMLTLPVLPTPELDVSP